jgi:hypothetical protein
MLRTRLTWLVRIAQRRMEGFEGPSTSMTWKDCR